MAAGEGLMFRPGCRSCRHVTWARGDAPKKGLLMIRPLLVLATVFLTILGGAGADAAELLAPVLAQAPSISRGPGLYLNLYKFIPVVVIYLLWTWSTDWVEHDTKELNNVKFAPGTAWSFSPGCSA